jgi:hypothetical protein
LTTVSLALGPMFCMVSVCGIPSFGRLVLPRLFLRGGRLGCMSAHLIQTTCLNMVPALLLLTKFMKPSLLKSGCSNNG